MSINHRQLPPDHFTLPPDRFSPAPEHDSLPPDHHLDRAKSKIAEAGLTNVSTLQQHLYLCDIAHAAIAAAQALAAIAEEKPNGT